VVRSTARLRDRPVLAAQIAALSTEVGGRSAQQDGSSGFPRGALDALEWVTHGGPGPLTGVLAMVPVAGKVIVGELAAAEDITSGASSRHRDYARGVGPRPDVGAVRDRHPTGPVSGARSGGSAAR
jgi:hypothetical protein